MFHSLFDAAEPNGTRLFGRGYFNFQSVQLSHRGRSVTLSKTERHGVPNRPPECFTGTQRSMIGIDKIFTSPSV